MQKLAQSLGKPQFDQWKEYYRCLEEMTESKEHVNKFRKENQNYKRSVQHVLENCDKEVSEASRGPIRGKHFVKWSIPVMRQ